MSYKFFKNCHQSCALPCAKIAHRDCLTADFYVLLVVKTISVLIEQAPLMFEKMFCFVYLIAI
jgi:hypothetical protein